MNKQLVPCCNCKVKTCFCTPESNECLMVSSAYEQGCTDTAKEYEEIYRTLLQRITKIRKRVEEICEQNHCS